MQAFCFPQSHKKYKSSPITLVKFKRFYIKYLFSKNNELSLVLEFSKSVK